MSKIEDAAYDYLRRISGVATADWAREHRNGTWDQAIEAVGASELVEDQQKDDN